MQTEFSFTLPRGFVDDAGVVQREGTIRRATARDEIEPLRDPAEREYEAYLTVLLLARVVTRLGDLPEVSPEVVEQLFASDLDHLQKLYERLNTPDDAVGAIACPACRHEFEVDLSEIEDRRLGG